MYRAFDMSLKEESSERVVYTYKYDMNYFKLHTFLYAVNVIVPNKDNIICECMKAYMHNTEKGKTLDIQNISGVYAKLEHNSVEVTKRLQLSEKGYC